MTTGEYWYLVMALVVFGAFSVMLAWQTWEQTSLERKKQRQSPDYHDTGHEISA